MKKYKFIIEVITLNIDTLELFVAVLEYQDDLLVGEYSIQLPNPFQIYGTGFEFHLN